MQGQGSEFMQWLQHTQLTSLTLTMDAKDVPENGRCTLFVYVCPAQKKSLLQPLI